MAGGNVPAGLRPTFIAAGHKYHIPPEVLAGISSVETNLGANATTSSTGATGLMQFEPGTAASLHINPLDPRQAIYGAARLLDQYGYQSNPTRAIGAYNGGPGNPQAAYAAQVLSEAKRLRAQLSGAASSVAGSADPTTQALLTPGSTAGAAGGDLFGAQHNSEILYGVVFLGAVLMALFLLGQGLNQTTHGAAARAAKHVAHAGEAAAVIAK